MNINQASFNLVTGPLMRVVYFEDNLTGNDRIFWVIHHLVVDGGHGGFYWKIYRWYITR